MSFIGDEELLRKYKSSGSLDDYTELYSRYMALVYGLCLKHLKNQADAEDAVMDLYEKLSQKLRSHEIQNYKSWLYSVCRNHCLEFLRKKNPQIVSIANDQIMHSNPDFHPDSIQKDNEVNLLHICIEALDKSQKDCIHQFYFEKKSYLEISESLCINFNQVRSRIQNGRRNIKLCMDQHSKKEEF